MTPALELVSHALCPYVQRAAIALAEKQVRFERRYIDLAHKPDWFLALSPLGKVPLLRSQEGVLFESAAILEYLDDTQSPPLHPPQPHARAQHRGWMEFGSTVLADIARFYNAPDASTLALACRTLRQRFETLEAALGDGPWFGGSCFSLVDAVFGPVFRYWEVFDQIADFGMLDGLPKVQAWRAALADRASVRAAVGADYAARLWDFLAARESELARLMRPS
ncbi:glutathione S-transferase family protein [Chitinimonas naiadis]